MLDLMIDFIHFVQIYWETNHAWNLLIKKKLIKSIKLLIVDFIFHFFISFYQDLWFIGFYSIKSPLALKNLLQTEIENWQLIKLNKICSVSCLYKFSLKQDPGRKINLGWIEKYKYQKIKVCKLPDTINIDYIRFLEV